MTTSILILISISFAPLLVESGSGASASEVRRLKGVNEVSSEQGASLIVLVPEGAAIDLRVRENRRAGPTSSIDLKNPGTLSGLALIPEPPPESLGGGAFYLVAGRHIACAQVCPSNLMDNFVFTSGDGDSPRGITEVPAGRYRLHLFGDEEDQSATIRLRGLRGKAKLEVGSGDWWVTERPTESALSGLSETYYSGGTTFPRSAQGLVVANLIAEGGRGANHDWGLCGYVGPSSPPAEIAYGPHCNALPSLGAQMEGRFEDSRAFSVNFLSDFNERVVPPSLDGRQGFGAWISSSSKLKKVSATFTVITLRR